MSWDQTIISSADAIRRCDDPDYMAQTPLGPYRSICEWITSHASQWHKREYGRISVTIGEQSSLLFHLTTRSYLQMLRDARKGDSSIESRYAPHDDEDVMDIFIEGRGFGGDASIIGECAKWLNAIILDHQTSELLEPEEWIRRSRPSDVS